MSIVRWQEGEAVGCGCSACDLVLHHRPGTQHTSPQIPFRPHSQHLGVLVRGCPWAVRTSLAWPRETMDIYTLQGQPFVPVEVWLTLCPEDPAGLNPRDTPRTLPDNVSGLGSNLLSLPFSLTGFSWEHFPVSHSHLNSHLKSDSREPEPRHTEGEPLKDEGPDLTHRRPQGCARHNPYQMKTFMKSMMYQTSLSLILSNTNLIRE